MRLGWFLLVCAVGFALGAALLPIGIRTLRAGSLLNDLAGQSRATREHRQLQTRDVQLASGARARHYVPTESVGQYLVLVHGVHHLGIDEPRLVAFAEHLASQGVAVFTPELSDLTNYELTERALDELIGAVQSSECEQGAEKIALIGLSFSGGLALIAASAPTLASRLSYVASIGGHHDLGRVLRFFISNRAETPDGFEPRRAHDYGLVLLTYTHLARLVPAQDVELLRAALRAWLAEDRATARALAAERSSLEAERVFVLLEDQQLDQFSDELGRALEADAPRLARLSPKGTLARAQLPVFVLHGREDSVIPASEAEWTELELESTRGANWDWPRPLGSGWVLVTPLLDHVSLAQPSSTLDELRLLGFWAQLL